LKGTAATERSAERPGDGASPGACAVDQITPERPEERPAPARVRARSAARWRLSRTGKPKYKRSERMRLTPYPFLPVFAGQAKGRANAGSKGLAGRAKRVVPRGGGNRLVPLAELFR